MATQSNTGFHHHHHHHHHHLHHLPHHHQPQPISFQSGIATAASEIITASSGNNYYNHHGSTHLTTNSLMTAAGSSGSAGSMVFSATPAPSPPGGAMISCSNNSSTTNNNPSNNSGISQPGPSFGLLLLDSVPGLKHDAGLAVEWSLEEQYKLEEGLVKFADEPTIMKYIKIAAVLRDKTVRDVALRCRWMTRKRRKQEDHNVGKKVKDRRDRIESCLKTNMSSASPNVAAYSIPLQPRDQSDSTSPTLIGTTRHLLEENNQTLGQISANLTTLKLQDNVHLFLRTRSNLTSVLNDMRNMPGIMSQMPPLPAFINEELVNSILSSSTQCMMFGSSSGFHLKQEPGC